jgi:tetratricopeptide (TPR) repeat protein
VADRDASLTNQELMHVALHAEREGRTQEMMEALKQILSRDADDAKALYMLGAVHAQIGMTEEAVSEMTRAVELEPELITAHFQLGLLHFMAERYEEAAQAWQPLDASPEDDPLYLFKTGLLSLAGGEYEASIKTIETGIANNRFNEALNDDMRGFVDRIHKQMLDLGIPDAKDERDAALTLARRAARMSGLSVYQRDDSYSDD